MPLQQREHVKQYSSIVAKCTALSCCWLCSRTCTSTALLQYMSTISKNDNVPWLVSQHLAGCSPLQPLQQLELHSCIRSCTVVDPAHPCPLVLACLTASVLRQSLQCTTVLLFVVSVRSSAVLVQLDEYKKLQYMLKRVYCAAIHTGWCADCAHIGLTRVLTQPQSTHTASIQPQL
jgi:hypothetical protein